MNDDVKTLINGVADLMMCDWEETEEGTWETECKNAFEFSDGGPTDNYFKFCCYCGMPLHEIPYKP